MGHQNEQRIDTAHVRRYYGPLKRDARAKGNERVQLTITPRSASRLHHYIRHVR